MQDPALSDPISSTLCDSSSSPSKATSSSQFLLSGPDAATLLCLLSRFHPAPESSDASNPSVSLSTEVTTATQSVAVLELGRLRRLEAKFLLRALDRINGILHHLHLRLRLYSPLGQELDNLNEEALLALQLRLTKTDPKQAAADLSWPEVRELQRNLRQQMATKNQFDYEPQVNAIVKECVEVVLDICGPTLEPHGLGLRSIVPAKIQFHGDEYMVRYETDFMGGARNVMWPDANEYDTVHIDYIFRSVRKKVEDGFRMVYRDYHYECLTAPLHELMHCIQTELRQEDLSSWIAEHDASRLALVLIPPLQERENTKQFYPPGKLEEVALFFQEQLEHIHPSLAAEQVNGYHSWRDAWGLTPPSTQDAFTSAAEDGAFTDYTKYRVGLEAYMVHEGRNLGAILDTCFKDRTGPLDKIELKLADEVLIPTDHAFEQLVKPAAQLWAEASDSTATRVCLQYLRALVEQMNNSRQ